MTILNFAHKEETVQKHDICNNIHPSQWDVVWVSMIHKSFI